MITSDSAAATTAVSTEAAQPTPPALEIHDMTVAYHRKPVLWDVDLTVPEGNLVGIVGPNGAGKSTLIKAALGLIPLASGGGGGSPPPPDPPAFRRPAAAGLPGPGLGPGCPHVLHGRALCRGRRLHR